MRCRVIKDHKRLQSRSNISKSPTNYTPLPHYPSSGLVTWYVSNDSMIALHTRTAHPVDGGGFVITKLFLASNKGAVLVKLLSLHSMWLLFFLL